MTEREKVPFDVPDEWLSDDSPPKPIKPDLVIHYEKRTTGTIETAKLEIFEDDDAIYGGGAMIWFSNGELIYWKFTDQASDLAIQYLKTRGYTQVRSEVPNE